MKKYKLQVGKENLIIPELAKQFGVKYTYKLGEYSLKVPPNIGSGKMQGINFPNGIGLYIMKVSFSKPTELVFTNDNIKPLRFIYCLKDQFRHTFDRDEDWQILEPFQHLISAAKQQQRQTLLFDANAETELCYLEINRQKFQDYVSFQLSDIKKELFELFADVNGIRQICTKGYFSMEVSHIITQIITYKRTGFARINYLGGKALEILSHMLTIYENENKQERNSSFKEANFLKVKLAADYIDDNLTNLENIPQIARIAGLNTTKMQEGFRLMYDKTANEYIRDKRLKLALRLLAGGNKNINEVVMELGLSSRSYFSRIFKEEYGLTPKEFVKNSTKSKSISKFEFLDKN